MVVILFCKTDFRKLCMVTLRANENKKCGHRNNGLKRFSSNLKLRIQQNLQKIGNIESDLSFLNYKRNINLLYNFLYILLFLFLTMIKKLNVRNIIQKILFRFNTVEKISLFCFFMLLINKCLKLQSITLVIADAVDYNKMHHCLYLTISSHFTVQKKNKYKI